ncbi:MAG: hypothetical protein L0H79_09280, partial [Intrasporangium sp.]|nr:hypothetical protein [Intrasporangium sp.]
MNDQLRTALRSGMLLLAPTVSLAAVLAGCAGPPPPPSPQTFTSVTTFSSPAPEPTTTASPTRTRDDVQPVAVSLPRLPIGGDSTTSEADAALQCVDVSWIVTKTDSPDIPPGYAVQVTGATFSDKGFEAVTGACEAAAPACVGRIMRTGSTRCSLAVRALPDADPEVTVRVGLEGTAYCPSGVGDRCQRFADAVAREPGITI